MASSTILGIDLGTTNSLVAVTRAGVPVVLPDPATGETLLPSVVYFPADGSAPRVGKAAQAHFTTEPERTVFSAKRLMGKGYADAQAEAATLPYALDPNRENVATIQIDEGHTVTPPEVGAYILRALKERAAEHLGESVTRAVITVPAYFNDAQRQATKDAGEIAGLEVVRIVNEPTAASLAYGLQNKQSATIAVYDLGGGTFDISILRLESGLFEVLATNGDTHLGGDDFDEAVTQLLLEEIGVSAPDASLRATIRLAAEAAKRRLSTHQAAVINIALPGREHVLHTLHREDFEKAIAPLVERTLAPCRQALADAGLTTADIDEVVMVGGSSTLR